MLAKYWKKPEAKLKIQNSVLFSGVINLNWFDYCAKANEVIDLTNSYFSIRDFQMLQLRQTSLRIEYLIRG